MFSTNVVLAALSTKIAMVDGKADMYHSLLTSLLGFEAVKILFKSFLKRELKYFIGSLDSAFKFNRSLISVAVDLSSPNLVNNFSWKMSQLVMNPNGNEKY